MDKRSREEAQAQMTVKPICIVQHCSPCTLNPDMPSSVCFRLENTEGELDPGLKEPKSSSASTGLNTPGQQCPPNEGIRETGRTTASGTLTAGASSSKKRNISISTGTVAGISSTAATPEYRRLKTFSEENKQFDPGGQREIAPPWDAAVTLPFFSGESWEAPCCFLFVLRALCFLCVCFPELIFSFTDETYPQDQNHEERSRIKPMKYANGGQAFSPITLLKLARTTTPGLVVAQTL